MHQATINHSNTCYASHRFNTVHSPCFPPFRHMYAYSPRFSPIRHTPLVSRPFNVLPPFLGLSTYSLRCSPFQHTHPASHPFTLAPTPPFSPFQHTILYIPSVSRPFNVSPLLLILAFNTFPLLLTLSTYSRCFSLFKHAHPAFHPSTYMLQTSYQHFPPYHFSTACFNLLLTLLNKFLLLLILLKHSNCFSPL
jgi:hypothetical protein